MIIKLSVHNKEHNVKTCTGCTLTEEIYPFIGLYKGIYLSLNENAYEFIDYMHAASWNNKSELAIKSINTLTNKSIRTASLNKKDGEFVWCLGFGWK